MKKTSSIKYYTVPNSLKDKLLGFGNIKGNITWQYNEFIGTKADVGAKVFLIPTNFDPSKFKKSDMELYASMGFSPKGSYLYFGKVDGFGHYEIPDVRAGKYLILISSHETNRNMEEPVDVKDIFEPRLGSAYKTFELFNLGIPKYKWGTIEIKKGKTLTYSYDFGYTYF